MFLGIYHWLVRCSRQYIHRVAAFQKDPFFSLCSCTWRKCTARLERGRSISSSTSSTLLSPRRTDNCRPKSHFKWIFNCVGLCNPIQPIQKVAETHRILIFEVIFSIFSDLLKGIFEFIFLSIHWVNQSFGILQLNSAGHKVAETHGILFFEDFTVPFSAFFGDLSSIFFGIFWEDLPAVFHVERFIHTTGDLDAEVLVSGTFRHFHLMPFGKLKSHHISSINFSIHRWHCTRNASGNFFLILWRRRVSDGGWRGRALCPPGRTSLRPRRTTSSWPKAAGASSWNHLECPTFNSNSIQQNHRQYQWRAIDGAHSAFEKKIICISQTLKATVNHRLNRRRVISIVLIDRSIHSLRWCGAKITAVGF